MTHERVAMVFRYEVSYTGVSPGLQRLYGRGSDVNNHILHVLRMREYAHSQYPFTMTACSDPTQLSRSVRVITDLNGPYGIAFNSRGEMIVSEYWGEQISVFNIRGERIRTIRSRYPMNPRNIAIDDMDNIYVSSDGQLQKFTSSGELTECVRKIGSNEVEFDPRGVTLHNNYVYVCDSDNHCIRVFDLDLNFIKTIGPHSKGNGEFNTPEDIKFDTNGDMYVTQMVTRPDLYKSGVQVLDSNGHFIRVFGEERRISYTLAHLHIIDKYVYASFVSKSSLPRSDVDFYVINDFYSCIVVYKTSGEFVSSFGDVDYEEEEFRHPASIASCPNGFVYVCDLYNDS